MSTKSVVVGLISDTHAPDRCKELPRAIFEALAGVDLILHAGDVGELWVLDQLSTIAPIVAVHGNDETDEATAALPYLQTVSVAGQRIVLTHSHHPDAAEEMESRKDDRWEPKLSRRAEFGRQHGANIIVYGHSHIPMQLEWEGVLLINPGAIASGGNLVRQTIKTVARLHLEPNAKPRVEHVDLFCPSQRYAPAFDYPNGFLATAAPYSESILAPELEASMGWVREEVYPLAPQHILKAFNRAGHRCWSGEQEHVTPEDIAREILSDAAMPLEVVMKLRELPVPQPYLQT
jgi:putative phosphoesterase